jgi:ankyrin repeat protein
MDELRSRLQQLSAMGQPPPPPALPAASSWPWESNARAHANKFRSHEAPSGRQLQLRVCGIQLQGIRYLECGGEHTLSLQALLRYMELKFGLASVLRLECWRDEVWETVTAISELPERAMVRVMGSAGTGRRPYPYTLHHAAADADVGEVRELLTLGRDPDAICGQIRGSVLHQASRSTQAADSDRALVVKGLLASGRVDPVARDRIGRTPLHLAAQAGNVAAAVALVQSAPTLLHSRTDSGGTPLHAACYRGHAAVVDALTALCDVGAGTTDRDIINALDSSERTPLHWAAERGHLAATSAMLAATRRFKDTLNPINAVDQLQRTPLHLACLGGYPAIVQLLVRGRADVRAPGYVFPPRSSSD